MLIAESLGFAAFFIGVLVYFLTDSNAEMWQKILFPSAVLLLSSAIILFEYIFGSKVKVLASYNFYQTTFALFVIEVVIMLLFGSLMKALSFGFELFPIIIICQLMVLFVNVAINSVVVTSLLKLTNKYFIEKIN